MLVPVVAIAFIITASSIYAVGSSTNVFSASPDLVWLNWTNYSASINITNNAAYTIRVAFFNSTTGIQANYSQKDFYLNSSYPQYWWQGNTAGCFAVASQYDSPLLGVNSSGYSNLTGSLSPGGSELLTIIHAVACPPGRYWGYVNFTNATNRTVFNTSEWLRVNITLDIPVSTANQLIASTGTATVYGRLPANSSSYHSYFFNTSNMTNGTSVVVNLSWSDYGKDMDLFLLDGSGNLKAKSIKAGSEESLNYQYLPVGEVWESRIYGNITTSEDYTLRMSFSTLNITNATSGNMLSSASFGEMNASQSQVISLTIRNEGNLTPTVYEAREVYHMETFSGSGETNHSFVVPNFATKVKASLNWSGGSNYTLNLYRLDGSLAGTSTNRHINAKHLGVMREEFVETSTITDGVWKAQVANNSGTADSYTLYVMFWVSENDWLASNYSTTTFNTTGLGDWTKNFQANLTVPANSLDGLYKGYLRYWGSLVELPLEVNVTGPVLLVNNTLESGSVRMGDNIGFNRTGNQVSFSVPINNTGDLPLTLTSTNSSGLLTMGSYFMNLSYAHDSSIGPGQSGTLQANVTINTDDTGNQIGNYTGWVYLNSSTGIPARPYSYYNLSIAVELSGDLIVKITQIDNWYLNNASAAQNVTPHINVYYSNGTEVIGTASGGLQAENFTFWMTEGDVTTHRVPTSGYLSHYNRSGGGGVYDVNNFKPQVTVPSGQVGGHYYLHTSVTHYVNGNALTGSNYTLRVLINDTGLQAVPLNSTTLSMNEGTSSTYFWFNVTNYGPRTATGTFTLSNGTQTAGYARASAAAAGCGSFDSSNNYFTVDIAGNGTETCWYKFLLYSNNVSSNEVVYFTASFSESSFGTVEAPNVTIINLTTSEEEEDEGDGGGSTSCNSDNDCAADYYCYNPPAGSCRLLDCDDDEHIVDHACVPYSYDMEITGYPGYLRINLGSSNSTTVKVKNTGNGPLTAKLNLSLPTGVTGSVSPSAYSLDPDEEFSFSITFNCANNTVSGNQSSKFIAWMYTQASVKDEKNFIIYVVPTEERKAEITARNAEYSATLADIIQRFNEIKAGGFLSQDNITTVQTLIDDAQALSADITEALAAGDFSNAENYLVALESKINRLNQELDELSTEQQLGLGAFQGSIWMWGAAAVIIIGAGAVLVYMLLPPGGYVPGKGYRPSVPGKSRKGSSLKGLLEKIKRHFGKAHQKTKEAVKGGAEKIPKRKKKPWER